MSKTNNFETNLLSHIFEGKALTNLGATGGSTDLWMSLHTADPGEAGSTGDEGGYAQYTRIAIQRSTETAGFTASSGSASPNANIDFPQNTSTSTGTFSFFGVNPTSVSTGPDAFYTGSISPTINFSQNVTPRLTTGSSITED